MSFAEFVKSKIQEIEDNVIAYWIGKTNLTLERSYPKKVSYIKNTMNTKLKLDDYGTLIIEVGSNLFSQIIKNFVKNMTQNIVNFEKSEVKHFMRGIIAGESCVEIHIPSKKYRIHISANDKDEKLIYYKRYSEANLGESVILSKETINRNIEILKSADVKDLEIFYKIHQEVVKVQKFVPFSLDYLTKEFLAFLDSRSLTHNKPL